ncbi:MAG: hypothetical protein LBS23_01310, partial [Holosporaceae bacterium]|nr:hypothetical protein [Holosporaceae bacterium]
MQLSARIQATIEMLDIFFSLKLPLDIIMAKFFKHNKWIGVSDRRAIAEFSFSIFRNFEKMKLLTANITTNFGRFYVLTFLKVEEKWSTDKIAEAFCGRRYAPSQLTMFERQFINSIDNRYKEFPSHVKYNYSEWLQPYLQKSFSESELANEMLA